MTNTTQANSPHDVEQLRAALAEAEARQAAEAARREARIEEARMQRDRALLDSAEAIAAGLRAREAAARESAQQAARQGDFQTLYSTWLEAAVVLEANRTLHDRFNQAARRLERVYSHAQPPRGAGPFAEWVERYTTPMRGVSAYSSAAADLHDSLAGDDIDTLEQADAYLA